MNPIERFQGGRLREVREARGLSATALAELAGLDNSAISHFENDRCPPAPETLQTFAGILRVPVHRFFLPTSPPRHGQIFWRSQSAATKQARVRAHRKYDWLLSVLGHLGGYVALPPMNFPPVAPLTDPRELSDDVIESLARECRTYWKLGAGPITNMVSLLENNGAIVVRCSMASESLDAFSHWNIDMGRPVLFLGNDKGSAARSLVDTAHEFAHMLLHRHVEERVFNSREVHKLMESQAMKFAGAFLLPPASFATDLYSISLDAFLSLKSRWRVSVQAMIMRAVQLDIVSPDEAKHLWIRLVRKGWKQHEPLDDTLPYEQPKLLAQCFDMLMERGFNPDAMATAVGLPKSDIEEVCGLPQGFLEAERSLPLKFKLVG